MRVDGFDIKELNTKSGRKLLVEVGNRDYSQLDKFIRNAYTVSALLVSDDPVHKMLCYKVRDK